MLVAAECRPPYDSLGNDGNRCVFRVDLGRHVDRGAAQQVKWKSIFTSGEAPSPLCARAQRATRLADRRHLALAPVTLMRRCACV
jgi:hypothetical protein